ncbi:MAG: methyl-accepting chemotaxis protein [Desulfobacteraceae bacterium]|nr:MAG: methyl-accepting chemotaxis protein [Desulfobacteraceae bacterium]
MGKTSIRIKLITYFLILLLVIIVVIETVKRITGDFYLAQGLSVALAMGIGTIFGIIFSRSLTLRLNKLSNAAREISDGNLTRDIEVISEDEIRDLEEIFSLMVKHLRTLLLDMKSVSIKIHETNSNLTKLAKKLLESSNDIDVTAKSIAKSSEDQTEIVRNTTIKLESGIKAMDELVNQSSHTISKVDEAIKKTQKGETNARETLSHLETVLKEMGEYSQPIIKLPDKVEKIKVVTNVMEAIAQKTDLLSLNASIEATRAGESGKGFAIVAEEIRNMAENSKQSSQAITRLVEDILTDNKFLKEFLVKNQRDLDKGREIIRGIVQTFGDMLYGVKEIFSEIKSMEESTIRQAKELRSFSDKFKELASFASQNYKSTQKTTIVTRNQKVEVKKIVSAIRLLDRLSEKMIETQQLFTLPELPKESKENPLEENQI